MDIGDLVNVTVSYHGAVGYHTPGIVLQHNPTADAWHEWTVLVEGEVRACHDRELNKISVNT